MSLPPRELGRQARTSSQPARLARLHRIAPCAHTDSNSFLSGHTASAFAFVSATTAVFPLQSLSLYGMATAVGYSRIHNGVHYPGDVMGGAILGLAIGTVVCERTLRMGERPRGR